MPDLGGRVTQPLASISPVITNVSGLPLRVECFTVVSNVFGKQFSNSQASSGSAIDWQTFSIVASTAGLTKLRFLIGGLCETKPEME